MTQALILTWFISAALAFLGVIVDSYFYPNFFQKRFFFSPEGLFYFSLWLFSLTLVVLFAKKIVSGHLPKGHRLILFFLILIWSSLLPLSVFVTHLTSIVTTHDDQQIIYTQYYHLNYDQVLLFQSFVQTYFQQSVWYLALLAPWLETYVLIKKKSARIRKNFGQMVANYLQKQNQKSLVSFVEKWALIFPTAFILLFVTSLVSSRLKSDLQPILSSSLNAAFYLLAATTIVVVLLRKKLRLPSEDLLLNVVATVALIILVAVFFSGQGLISKVVLSLFILCTAFIIFS